MNEKIARRVAVTGMGIVTAIGANLEDFAEGLFAGRCGIGPVTLFDTEGFPCRSAAQVPRVSETLLPDPRVARRISRCDHLGLEAAGQALEDAGLEPVRDGGPKVGVVLGGGAGGMLSWEGYRRSLWRDRRFRRPSVLLASAPCTLTDLVAGHYGFEGFRATITTACSSSATSLGYGFDLIRTGRQDVVITGGSEALSELTFAGFNALRLVDPEYCRPFDRNRKGLSLGEGAAVLVLEEMERAERRGRIPYAEILGYAVNADAHHMTSPDPEASGMTGVMRLALENAGLAPSDIDYVNAHGTATTINDRLETLALKRVFGAEGARKLSVSSTKSMVGHCLGAAGAVEAVATVLALYRGKVPPTIHLEKRDPDCDLDYVAGAARERDMRFAMSNSFAFGGNNTCVVFGRFGEESEGAP